MHPQKTTIKMEVLTETSKQAITFADPNTNEARTILVTEQQMKVIDWLIEQDLLNPSYEIYGGFPLPTDLT